MVNQRLGPDDRRQMRAQDGVTQEHASADVEMINTEFDNTQPSLDCSWGRFQIPKVKHQDTTFGSGKEIEPGHTCDFGDRGLVPVYLGSTATLPLSCVLGFGIAPAYLVGLSRWSIGLLWDWKAGFSGRGTRVLKVHIKVQTYSAQEPLADGCGEQGTTIAESNTARELSNINMRLDQQREDIDENNAMIAYIGNAQYTFESTLDRFEDQLDDHCLNCNQKPEKISDNSNELSFTARVKVARSLHQNKGQEGMRETNAALASENATLKEQVEKLTSTVADLMGRFAKLESTVHCKEAERKLGELEV
ncbi:hypothetical protein FMEXI_8712 [Fusarium mexicanum]|uniref:Uncharacterized protein n=1 Tax=Fusarium mexicanum TaxID=751941 RepID=A0A8H5IN05_9HYPO|nr:hypothetical protein FMEXI_8712 [Fusarium mexicanum]